MEGVDAVPVEDAEDSFGSESCGHGHVGLGGWMVRVVWGFVWFDVEVEDCDSGEFHFGAEGEGFVVFDADDSPEVEGFSELDAFLVASSSAESGSSDEGVHPSSEFPEDIRGVPAVPSTDATDRFEDMIRWGVDGDGSFVGEGFASGPVGVSGDWACDGPAGLDIS